MSKTPSPAPTPAAGGSYLAQPDGTLTRVIEAKSDQAAPAAMQPTAAPATETKTSTAKE